MRLFDIIGLALATFINNKMRTILTIFGISIGIGAIVFLVSIGYGLQAITIGEIQSIKALKTYNVTSGDSSILSMGDDAIAKFKKVENVTSVDPSLSMSGQIGYEKSKTDVLVNAVNPEYLDLEAPRLQAGNNFTQDKDNSTVVTAVIANAFSIDPKELVGKKIKLTAFVPNPENDKQPFMTEKELEVKGVIKDNVASYIYVPLGIFEIPAKSQYTTIKVNVSDSKHMTTVKNEITTAGYKATSIGEKVDQMNQVFRIAQIVLLILGAIALVVASIGMFNTLTISLLERTKDIGVMKALGVTDREIYLVFLSEAGIISITGGVTGIITAFILGNVLNIAISQLAVRAGGEAVKIFQAPIQFIGVVLAFSAVVGIMTGLYPAKRAAKLNPLDALRYE